MVERVIRGACATTQFVLPGVPLGAEDSDQFFTEPVTHATHRELLITAIQRLADGSDSDIDGIMCFMPPGSAKSTYLTNVMALSYGQELVNRFARRTRQIARSPEFNKITGTPRLGTILHSLVARKPASAWPMG